MNVLSVFGSLSLTYSSFFAICSVGSNRTELHNLFIMHSSRKIRPLFRVSVTGHPANAGQELPDCSAVSDAILAEREEASLQTNTLASYSLPRWLTNQVVRD